MKNKSRLTTHETAEFLGVCPQRVLAKINQGHFPGAERCECGRSIMIPKEEVELDKNYRNKKGV